MSISLLEGKEGPEPKLELECKMELIKNGRMEMTKNMLKKFRESAISGRTGNLLPIHVYNTQMRYLKRKLGAHAANEIYMEICREVLAAHEFN